MLVIFIREILSDFRRINGRDVYRNGATKLSSSLSVSPVSYPFIPSFLLDSLAKLREFVYSMQNSSNRER